MVLANKKKVTPQILVEGECLKDYLAKCHEAFRTGLKNCFDTRFFGKGYEGFDTCVTSYSEIIERSGFKPDLFLVYGYDNSNGWRFHYQGLEDVQTKKAIFLCDFWSEAQNRLQAYIEMIERYKFDYIFSFFPQPLEMWKDTKIGKKLIYVPPCFDPDIFRNWKENKAYDVGFLADGTVNPHPFYPERKNIHDKILKEKGLNYLWANHPGWGRHNASKPLVGENFSRAINSCKIFVTTGGIYKNPQPKIFEALASYTLLMSTKSVGQEEIGLIDGENFICIDESNVIDKIRYYLRNEAERKRITEAGYRLVMQRHSCNARVIDCLEKLAIKGF